MTTSKTRSKATNLRQVMINYLVQFGDGRLVKPQLVQLIEEFFRHRHLLKRAACLSLDIQPPESLES
jgi:hypothetical protein